MTEPDRGDSYLEIQMDRSTIVLAALGILVFLVLAFLLGSWTATRKANADRAGATALDAGAADAAPDSGSDAAEQDVDAEPNFGGRPVSASGAPPLTAVPAPAATGGNDAAARPKGTSGITVASDGTEEVVVDEPVAVKPSTSTTSKTSTAKPTTKPPAKPATKPTSTSTAAPASTTSTSSTGWVVQVAAVKERSEADALKKRLEGKGYPVRILEEGGFLKVQVGPYAEKSEAQSAEQRLKRERGLATWVKKA